MKPRPANRLRMRKGRSVMHMSLEDNYGAVVVANHEALAQVLEQVCAKMSGQFFCVCVTDSQQIERAR